MKNNILNQIRKCLLFVTLCSWTISSLSLINSSDSTDSPSTSAVFTSLIDSPIFIDDLDTEYNWNTTCSSNPWCTGKGTSEDPYIIQNIIISSANSDSIIVSNSDVFFMIANCIVQTSMGGGMRFGSGIVFDNVTNGIIISSEIFENKHDGIGLYNSYNILIYNNYIHNNKGSGIKMGNCSDIELNKNIITHQDFYGIEQFESNYTKIHNNEVVSNNDGIVLSYSLHNELKNNSIYNNTIGVFLLRHSHYNKITSNRLSNNEYCVVISTSCKYTYYDDNDECQYYSYDDLWTPPPPSPPDENNDEDEGIPGYDLFLLFGVICMISFIIIKKKRFYLT
jgi:parallel beta-helix repeat protein